MPRLILADVECLGGLGEVVASAKLSVAVEDWISVDILDEFDIFVEISVTLLTKLEGSRGTKVVAVIE